MADPLVSVIRFLSFYFKLFWLYALLYDAAGAMWAHSGKGLVYCYKIGRSRNSCSLSHLTGLTWPLSYLYVKHFLPSILDSVDFWSSKSGIVLCFEFADKNVINELVFFDGIVQGYSFCPPKKYYRQGNQFVAQKTGTELCRTVDVWTTMSSPTFFPEVERMNIRQIDQKSAKFMEFFWLKNWKIWNIMAVP